MNCFLGKAFFVLPDYVDEKLPASLKMKNNYQFGGRVQNLCFGEFVKNRSIDSTVDFVYNVVTSSGT